MLERNEDETEVSWEGEGPKKTQVMKCRGRGNVDLDLVVLERWVPREVVQ
jgi:hypothetical protein